MRKIRLGIVGPGRITARVMADMHNASEVELVAIAARDLDRAKAAAEKYGAPIAYGSYAEMAQSDQVDLVYIATPHPFHAEQAMLMMRHGKHVLCEKPMTINHLEAQKMVDCARENGVFLMEAMWTRFMPCAEEMLRLIQAGEIGQVRHIFAQFSFHTEKYDPQDRVYDLALAGGALLDLGVYPLMACTQLLGSDPVTVQSLVRKTPEGVDMSTTVQMQYASGATAQFFCGMDASSNNLMQIFGTKGYITVPEFWRPTSFTLCAKGQEARQVTFRPEHEGHHYEFDHAARCIRQGLRESPVMPLDESLAVSRICTEIRHAHQIFYPGEC